MKKSFQLASVVFASTVLLSACVVPPQFKTAQNISDVKQGILDYSGTPKCRDCAKVQTHISSSLASYSWRYDGSGNDQGNLTGRIHIGVTNNQPNHSNLYFLKIEQTNSGVFNSGAGVLLMHDNGNSDVMPRIEQPDGFEVNQKQCTANYSSCWWTDYFQISSTVIQNAIDSGKPLIIDIAQVRSNLTNDGYKHKTELVPLGVRVNVNSEYLKAFRDELVVRGIQLPTN